MKESLFKRVAAIENRGVGLQIRTLADYVIWVARGCYGSPTIEPGLKALIHSFAERGRQQKQQEAWQSSWSMWERWLLNVC